MRKRSRGFTLLELMVTMAIVAILVTIAIPNYNQYVVRTRRNEAREAVMVTAAALERHFLNNNTYTDVIGTGGVVGTGLVQSGSDWLTRNGYYAVTIDNDGATPPGDWRVVATAIGAQASDSRCTSFIYFLSGTRAAEGGGGDPVAECWD